MHSDTLRKFTPFDGLQDEYLQEAIEHVEEQDLQKGHMIFKRGRTSARRYFLIEGRVELIDSLYAVQSIRGGSEQSTSMLNPENPTRCSCVVKDRNARIFSIEADVLDRLTAWSESAESAFEAEMSAKATDGFDPDSTGQFDVVTVDEEPSNDWMSSLLKSPLFERVPLTHVQELFTRFETRKVTAGDVIIKEGEKGDYFYVIAQGSAQIKNRTESVDVTVGPGKYFGEEALLGSTLRNATITMKEPGELKVLNSENFESLLKEPVLQYIDIAALARLNKPYKIIDVKMPLEYRIQHVKGSINLPLARLRATMTELAETHSYVISDDAGSRSMIAAHLMCQAGFDAMILHDAGVDDKEVKAVS